MPSRLRRFVLAALVAPLAAAGSWQVRNPLPTPDGIKDIEAVDKDLVYACGTLGQIFKSSDGGLTWEMRRTGAQGSLTTLDVAGRDTVFAAGFGGAMVRSRDGGRTWDVLRSGTTSSIWDVAAVDGLTVFAVSDSGTLLRTRDGGATWDSSRIGTTRRLVAVAAADRSHAWAATYRDTIYRTTDGGAAWTAHGVGSLEGLTSGSGGLEALSAVGRDTLWAAGRAGNVVQFRAVFRSTDGGVGWTRIDTAYGAWPYAISAADGSTAFVGCFSAQLRTTRDAGATWTETRAGYDNLDAFQWHEAVSAVDARTAFATGTMGRFFLTQDGGNAWTELNPFTRKHLLAVSVAEGGRVAFACGKESSLLKSEDAGMTWTPLAFGRVGLNPPLAIATRDGRRVLAAGFSLVMASENRGASWSRLDTASGHSFRLLVPAGGDTVFAAGGYGFLARSADWGRTWSPAASDTRADFRALALAGPRGVLAAGDSGILFRSTDAGETWTRLPRGSKRSILGLHFLDEKVGFAATDSGQVGRTEDGGATWSFVQVHKGGGPILNVLALDERNVLAGGSRGVLYRSRNGGTTWETDTTGVVSDLNALAFIGDDAVVAVGTEGAVIRSGPEPSGVRPERKARAAARRGVATRVFLGRSSGAAADRLRTVQGRAVAPAPEGRPASGTYIER